MNLRSSSAAALLLLLALALTATAPPALACDADCADQTEEACSGLACLLCACCPSVTPAVAAAGLPAADPGLTAPLLAPPLTAAPAPDPRSILHVPRS